MKHSQRRHRLLLSFSFLGQLRLEVWDGCISETRSQLELAVPLSDLELVLGVLESLLRVLDSFKSCAFYESLGTQLAT